MMATVGRGYRLLSGCSAILYAVGTGVCAVYRLPATLLVRLRSLCMTRF